MDVSIIVPHRGNPLGLWATLHSCQTDLERFGPSEFEFVVISNGEDLPEETQETLHVFKKQIPLKHVHVTAPMTPPAARQMGADLASGELLFFFDNHCLVKQQYFQRAVADFDKFGMDMLHSTTMFNAGDGNHYHYRLKLDYNFWAQGSMDPIDNLRPYMIAAAGHGGFAVKKSVWDDVGGYGPDSLFVGYGGEELIFDLKLWLYGYSVYLDPKVVHCHYAGKRGYSRHFTDEYYTNLMVSANVIGGEEWLYKVFNSFISKPHFRINAQKPYWDLLLEAYERSAQYAAEVRSRSTRDLNELLVWFRHNGVGM